MTDKIKEAAKAHANSLGHQSDKEQYGTTPWCEWNIRERSFIAGATSEAAREYWEGQGWVRVKDRLPEDGQIVDIWEMPRTQHLERALSLRGTDYANEYYHDTDYYGWRSTNYKFTIEHDNEGVINCFTKCIPRYFTTPSGGAEYKKLCVENGEVTHWRPLPAPPNQ